MFNLVELLKYIFIFVLKLLSSSNNSSTSSISLLFYYIQALGNWKDIKEFAKADVEDDGIIVKCVCQIV